MAEKISISKGFDDNTFDTYVPELEEAADIRNALELFFYGNSEDGNATGDVSIHATLVDFDTRIDANDAAFDGHTGAISDVHGTGAGNVIVGTGTVQTLTNKTLTSPVITGGTVNGGAALTVDSTELNYVDGVTSAIQTQINTNTPTGMISIHSGSVAPTGWLLCDGTSYASASYTTLFNVIGYTFGGSGANFSVPNLKGKVVVGIDNSQVGFDTLGETGGAMTHQHTIAASNAITSSNHDGHGHTGNLHSHGFNVLQTNGDGAHNHTITVTNNDSGSHGHNDNFAATTGIATITALAPTSGTPGGQTSRNHTHAVSVTGSVTSGGNHSHANTAANAGGGNHNHSLSGTNADSASNAQTAGAHAHTTTVPQHTSDSLSNLQPYMALNYIIKF